MGGRRSVLGDVGGKNPVSRTSFGGRIQVVPEVLNSLNPNVDLFKDNEGASQTSSEEAHHVSTLKHPESQENLRM